MATVEGTFNAGQLVRLWCFRCFRHDMMSPEAMQRSWTREVASLKPRCKKCRRSDQTIALPASDRDWEAEPNGKANSRLVESFFHGMRSAGKKRRL